MELEPELEPGPWPDELPGLCDEPDPDPASESELVVVSVPVTAVPEESASHNAHDTRNTMETRTAAIIGKVFLFIFYSLLFFLSEAIIKEEH